MALAQLMLFLALFLPIFGAHGFIQPFTSQCPDQKIHKQVFYSPPFAPSPGEVLDKFYHGIPFPKGHVGIRNFNAEVVDEHGNSIPLHEVYLHHWVVVNYYVKKGEGRKLLMDSVLSGGNDGVCPHHMLSQFWGLGSETRHTDYSVPPPYAIPTGDPKKIPEGYEEAWLLNVHAIDTRGAVDPKGCFECRCDLYNISRGSTGQPVPKNYKGGLFCCQDGAQCLVKEGFRGEKRTLYLRYTIEWVEWDECVVPVRSYIFDATYDGKFCKIEYNTPLCSEDSSSKTCTHILEAQATIPKGGNLIYAVAHQHSGGIGAALYGQDGRELCTSTPLYGTGRSPGNEKGYIVGMGSCYPENGSAKINDNEVLRVQSRCFHANSCWSRRGWEESETSQSKKREQTEETGREFETSQSKKRWCSIILKRSLSCLVARILWISFCVGSSDRRPLWCTKVMPSLEFVSFTCRIHPTDFS